MDRDLLQRYLGQGLSLIQIGVLMNRDPSTIGYWVRRHGLVANGRHKYAPRGGLTANDLKPLIERGLTLREISEALGVSVSTVRHWMAKFGLRTKRHRANRNPGSSPKPAIVVDACRYHGQTEFILEGRGAYRCKRCRSESVAKWRRSVKRTLIDEAGGSCAICGYDRHPGALHFHHLDPSAKEFALSHEGLTRALATTKAEAAKCVLLCANCHAEVEAGVASLS